MMFAMPAGLGLIPDWQFSNDPRINININPHVKIPSEWPYGQRTVQPLNYFVQGASGDPLAVTNGLTVTPDAQPMVAGARITGLGITRARWMPAPHGLGMFDSWAFRNRKWLVVGGIGLVGLAALAGASVLLR
jgi:hypothetical protein